MAWVKGCCEQHDAAGISDPQCPGMNIMIENVVCAHCQDRVPLTRPAPYNSVAGFADRELSAQRSCTCGAIKASEAASP